MEIVSISAELAVVELDGDELRLLAKACAEAVDKVDGQVETLAAMHGCFQALALAAHAYDTPMAICGRQETWAAYDAAREAAQRRLVEHSALSEH